MSEQKTDKNLYPAPTPGSITLTSGSAASPSVLTGFVRASAEPQWAQTTVKTEADPALLTVLEDIVAQLRYINTNLINNSTTGAIDHLTRILKELLKS